MLKETIIPLRMKAFARAFPKVIETRYQSFCLFLILTVALLCRLYPLNRGLGQDELYTAVHFVEVRSFWKTVFSNDAFNNHIGYSLMARFSESLLGRSEWALRLPALMLGMATLYIFLIFARSILGSIPALLGTLVLAFSPPNIVWSVEARGYSAMIFCTLLSSHLYFKLLRHPTRHDAILFVGISVFGIYVHLYSAFVTVVQILILLRMAAAQRVAQRTDLSININRTSLQMFGGCFAAIVALSLTLYLPVFRYMFRDLVGRGRTPFNPTFPWTVIRDLTGSEWPQIVLLILMISAFGWLFLLRSRPIEAHYFAGLLIGPLLLMWLARPFDLYPRFFAYWLPYYVLLFIAGLRSFWDLKSVSVAAPWAASTPLFGKLHFYKTIIARRSLFVIASSARILSGVMIAAVLYNWLVTWQKYIPDEGYREASKAIMMDAKDSVAFCVLGGARSVWRYYIDRPIVTPLSLAELQKVSRNHTEVRCLYYEASWQSVEQTEIAKFLFQHSSWARVKGVTLFIYRS